MWLRQPAPCSQPPMGRHLYPPFPAVVIPSADRPSPARRTRRPRTLMARTVRTIEGARAPLVVRPVRAGRSRESASVVREQAMREVLRVRERRLGRCRCVLGPVRLLWLSTRRPRLWRSRDRPLGSLVVLGELLLGEGRLPIEELALAIVERRHRLRQADGRRWGLVLALA